MEKKTSFEVTFSYKAIITVHVKAEDEVAAREIAHKDFNDKFRLPGAKNISIVDDAFKISGLLNLDETWNML